jgi:hypothetical protein
VGAALSEATGRRSGSGLSVVVLTNTLVAGVIGAFPAELKDAIYAEFEG